MAGIAVENRVSPPPIRVFFRPFAACFVAWIEPKDHHRELGEVEDSRTEVVPQSEVAGGRKWVRVEFRVFFNWATFTDEIFVGKGYKNFYRRNIRW